MSIDAERDEQEMRLEEELREDVMETEFDLALEEIPITLRRPGTSEPWLCVLREMNGFQRDMYLNSERPKMASARGDIKDFKDVQAGLISRCLFDQQTGEPVPIKDIRDFPSRVQHKLYLMCIKINGFDPKSQETAKNF